MAKRRSSLTVLSTLDLQREIRARQRRLPTLLKRRAKFMTKLDELDVEIRGLGGSTGATGIRGDAGRIRPKNDTNLTDALVAVLKGKTLGVSDAAEAVQAAGYKTSATNFRTIVNQNLLKNRKLFKKVSRGQYTAA